MQTIQFPVLVLVLVARLCRAEVVIESLTPDQATSNLVDDLIAIVTSCYGHRIHGGIGLAGDLPDSLLIRLSTQHLIPVVLIDNSTEFEGLSWPPMESRHKLPIFIVGCSAEEFQDIIQLRMKYSVWWDHTASFLIIDRSSKCRKMVQLLYYAGHYNMINSKVMCYNDGVGRVIGTSNPFTSQAPLPWRKFMSYPARNGHPMTMFYRIPRGKESICVNLDFDKVKDCGGHPILAKGIPPRYYMQNLDETAEATKHYLLVREYMVYTIYRALNVTPRYLSNDSLVNEDMVLKPMPIYNSWKFRLVSYPYSRTAYVLLSQFRGNKSQLEKILGVIDTNSHIGLGIAYLVTLIFFKFVVGQALVPAILNLVRITCGSGFENLSHSNPSRIYLTGILFFAVTMHGIFEGNLATLITTVIPHRNVKTIQNVLNFGYTLYGNIYERKALVDPEVRKHFSVVETAKECVMKVVHDKSSACILNLEGSALDVAKMFNLYVSDKVAMCYTVFEIRFDWPLEERFNTILSRLTEADVLEPWYNKCNPMKLENFQIDQEVKQNKDFKIMELHELRFAFVILGIGLVLASITFIVELGIHYRYTRTLGPRPHSQRRDRLRIAPTKIEVAPAPPILTVEHGP